MGAALAGTELGEFLLIVLLIILIVGEECGPVWLENSHATGPERHSVPKSRDGRHLLDAGRVEGRDQASDDSVVDLLADR